MAIWYYSVNGQQLGPVEEAELRRLAAARRIAPNDLVWQEGTAEWISAADAGFFAVGPASAPAVAPLPLTYATPTVTEAPLIEQDDGPFYKIGSQFKISGKMWQGVAVASGRAFYLLKIRNHMTYGHFGLIGMLLRQAFSDTDDLRTCDLNDLPQSVRTAMGRKGRRKSGNVIVLPKGAIHLVKTRGFNNTVYVSVGPDLFKLTTGLFSKGKIRRFLVDSAWTVDQEVIPTAAAIHGNGYGRPFEEVAKLKPSGFKRVLYFALAVAVIVLIIVLESQR